MKRPSFGEIGLLVGSSLLALVLVEGGLRLTRKSYYTFEEGGSALFEKRREAAYLPDPEIGYRPSPTMYPKWWKGTLNGKVHADHPVLSTTQRVLVLGDSLTEDRLLLQALQQGKSPTTDFRFFISATPGYNTLQEAIYLKRHVSFTPDYLILQFCFNDFDAPLVIVDDENGERFRHDTKGITRIPFPWLFRYSYIYQYLYLLRSDSPRAEVDHQDIVRRGLDQIQQYAKEKNIPLLVVIYPFLGNLPLNYQARRDYLGRALEQRSIPFIDLHSSLGQCDFKKIRRSADDELHPNLLGHSIAAQKIWDQLGTTMKAAYQYPEAGDCR